MAYPEPTPVLKGKAAKELIEKLQRSEKTGRVNRRWAGSRELYEQLRPSDSKK